MQVNHEVTIKGDIMLDRAQIQSLLSKFLKAKVVSRLSMIAGGVMLIGGLLLIFIDSATAESDSFRNIALSAVQTVEQVFGFPLPSYGFANNSISAIGIVALIVGVDLLMISLGLSVRSKIARWIAAIIFSLATFFDFSLFLLQGLLGAPAALPGTLINGLMVYILLKDRKWFVGELSITQ